MTNCFRAFEGGFVIRAMPALADARTASRIEQLFRKIGAAEGR